jgi:hypothetical protein
MDLMQRGFRPRGRSFRRLLVFIRDSFSRFLGGLKPQANAYRSQRMCHFCGLITARHKTSCLECGHILEKLPVG